MFVLPNWNNIRTVIVHIIPSVHNSIGEIFYLRPLPSAAPTTPTRRTAILLLLHSSSYNFISSPQFPQQATTRRPDQKASNLCTYNGSRARACSWLTLSECEWDWGISLAITAEEGFSARHSTDNCWGILPSQQNSYHLSPPPLSSRKYCLVRNGNTRVSSIIIVPIPSQPNDRHHITNGTHLSCAAVFRNRQIEATHPSILT